MSAVTPEAIQAQLHAMSVMTRDAPRYERWLMRRFGIWHHDCNDDLELVERRGIIRFYIVRDGLQDAQAVNGKTYGEAFMEAYDEEVLRPHDVADELRFGGSR